jgi:hypothetical protein
MATEGDILDGEELQIAELMMHGLSVRDIATRIGMSHTHAWRVGRRAHVREWVEASQRAAQDALRRAVVRVAPVAVQTLAEIAGDADAPMGARVQAASKLADLAIPRQSSVEVGGYGGGPVIIAHDDARRLLREQAAAMTPADLALPQPPDDAD